MIESATFAFKLKTMITKAQQTFLLSRAVVMDGGGGNKGGRRTRPVIFFMVRAGLGSSRW